MSADKLDNTIPMDTPEDGKRFAKWVELEVTLRSLGAQAAAGNKVARERLTLEGADMRAEMDELLREQSHRIKNTASPHDDIHTLTD